MTGGQAVPVSLDETVALELTATTVSLDTPEMTEGEELTETGELLEQVEHQD